VRLEYDVGPAALWRRRPAYALADDWEVGVRAFLTRLLSSSDRLSADERNVIEMTVSSFSSAVDAAGDAARGGAALFIFFATLCAWREQNVAHVANINARIESLADLHVALRTCAPPSAPRDGAAGESPAAWVMRVHEALFMPADIGDRVVRLKEFERFVRKTK